MTRSNNAPNINPTGTRFTGIPIYQQFYNGYGDRGKRWMRDHAAHTREWKAMMKIVGDYIRADYVVRYTERREQGVDVADVTCAPPLFPEELPQ